jgi:nickel transport protein
MVWLVAACAVLWFGCAATPRAHGLVDEVQQRPATVVSMRHADGTPFANAAFELRAEGSDEVLLSGRTDAQGRAVLLPEGPGPWRFRAYSDDGHGLERRIVAPQVPAEATLAASAGADRSSRFLFGAAVLAVVFAALQWLSRRKAS